MRVVDEKLSVHLRKTDALAERVSEARDEAADRMHELEARLKQEEAARAEATRALGDTLQQETQKLQRGLELSEQRAADNSVKLLKQLEELRAVTPRTALQEDLGRIEEGQRRIKRQIEEQIHENMERLHKQGENNARRAEDYEQKLNLQDTNIAAVTQVIKNQEDKIRVQ